MKPYSLMEMTSEKSQLRRISTLRSRQNLKARPPEKEKYQFRGVPAGLVFE